MYSIKVPERYRHHIHRDIKGQLLRQMQAKLAVMTRDNRISLSNGHLASTLAEAWTMEKAVDARRRDEKLELCHRHRHMHYPFSLPGMQKTRKPDDYYTNHVRDSDLDSDDGSPIPRRFMPQSRQAQQVAVKQMRAERDLLDHYLNKIDADQNPTQAQHEHSKELEDDKVQSDISSDNSKSPAKKMAKIN